MILREGVGWLCGLSVLEGAMKKFFCILIVISFLGCNLIQEEISADKIQNIEWRLIKVKKNSSSGRNNRAISKKLHPRFMGR